MQIHKLSILIPVYNEAKTISIVLDKISSLQLVDHIQKEVIIVNDGSSDNTEEAILAYQAVHTEMGIKYCKHNINKGKGAALHTGIKKVTGEVLVIQDADLEYNPQEFNSMLAPMLNGYANVVYGSRFIGDKPHRILFFWHYLGNKFLTFLSNMINNLNLTDMETCYKMFKTSVIKQLSLKEKRFGFEPEVTAKIAKIPNIKIYEVGIAYYGRTYAEGKKIGWRDGVRAIYCIVKYGLFSKYS